MTTGGGWKIWGDDVKMTKKDDDLVLPKHQKHGGQWQSTRPPRRSWIMRLCAYALIVGALVFLLSSIRNQGSPYDDVASSSLDPEPMQRKYDEHLAKAAQETPKPLAQQDIPIEPASKPGEPAKPLHEIHDEAPEDQKVATTPAQHEGKDSVKQDNPESIKAALPDKGQEKSASPDQDKASDEHHHKEETKRGSFDGPIRFPELAATLRRISATRGGSVKNQNVLFAAASLRSLSTLLPMACEMAEERENYVHFAFMGSKSHSVRELLKINGIDKTCPIIMHDARPDHLEESTERRLAKAVAEALYHVNNYMHPQAILVDSTDEDDEYFLPVARRQVRTGKSALIELPERPGQRLAWITKLDAAALSAWNRVRFDILIHAPPAGAGNIKRLLRSIVRADLAGIDMPHITVEMPHVVDVALQSFLTQFQWPASRSDDGPRPQMLSLRRRITSWRMDEADSSVRFLESFWPIDPAQSHVLVLSPHTEITPQFFHYVKYSLLHQLHSKVALMEDYDAQMMGISLSIPAATIDGTTQFTPPRPLRGAKVAGQETAFLWQRPNSDAMVFLGSKWVELHYFVARTLERTHGTGTGTGTGASSAPAMLAEKKVGKIYPAWLEYALQLARLRGYFTLYPSRDTANAILGVHSDLRDVPEEHQGEQGSQKKPSPKEFTDEGNESFDAASPVNVLETLPNKGELQSPRDLPLLSWDAKPKSADSLHREAEEYASQFRREVGQCRKADEATAPHPHVLDLFCASEETR